jgi:hypothetical protein
MFRLPEPAFVGCSLIFYYSVLHPSALPGSYCRCQRDLIPPKAPLVFGVGEEREARARAERLARWALLDGPASPRAGGSEAGAGAVPRSVHQASTAMPAARAGRALVAICLLACVGASRPGRAAAIATSLR